MNNPVLPMSILHPAMRSPVLRFLGVIVVALVMSCSSPPAVRAQAPSPQPAVTAVTSSSIEVRWPAVAHASHIRVLIAPEPSETPNGALPDAKLVATLPGSADRHRISGLAANVDVFIRVEADTRQGVGGANTCARTRGGPRAPLDTALREVQGWAPNALRIVMANGDGARWQSGRWTVKRRNGTAIPVRRVHRHSVPVAQPDYEIHRGGGNIRRVDVDHRLFLELGQNIGAREILAITGPNNVQFTLPFSDKYLETSVIQVNQVGYNPAATQRYAYVSGYMGSGGGLSLEQFPSEAEALRMPSEPNASRTVAAGDLGLRRRTMRLDPEVGTTVFEISLHNLPAAEGVFYRIRLPGVGVSYPTTVSNLGLFKAYWVTTRGLFLNRWAGDLRPQFTDWSRPQDHTRIFTAETRNAYDFHPRDVERGAERPMLGGYHDAGDFDQRPSHTVVAQTLLRAYERNPNLFPDGQLAIPESGNGIPDLLDEALWGVAGWEQLQEADGGVRAGVESYSHPSGFFFANEDELPYFTYARDANTTARAAGLFAQAARLVEPFNRNRAHQLSERAVRAANWARGNGASPQFLLYAFSELFRTTSSPNWKSAFEHEWNRIGEYGPFNSFAPNHLSLGDYGESGRVMPDFILGYLTHPQANPAFVRMAREWFGRYANEVVEHTLTTDRGFRFARPPQSYWGWGQGSVMGRYLDILYARMALGDVNDYDRQRYLDTISLNADYVLGCNALGMVFITGLGTRRPEEPLHTDSLAFMKRGMPPMPGIPVYGPVEETPEPSYYQPGLQAFFPSFGRLPVARRYGDIRTFVTTNECTIWECQAPHAQHFAMMLGAAMMPPRSWMPGQPAHRDPLPIPGELLPLPTRSAPLAPSSTQAPIAPAPQTRPPGTR